MVHIPKLHLVINGFFIHFFFIPLGKCSKRLGSGPPFMSPTTVLSVSEHKVVPPRTWSIRTEEEREGRRGNRRQRRWKCSTKQINYHKNIPVWNTYYLETKLYFGF
jgi:hypothetical protein